VAQTDFQVALMRLPSRGADDLSARALARALDDLMESAPALVAERISRWLIGRPIAHDDPGPFLREELDHELSRYMAGASTQVFEDGRSLAEMRALTEMDLPPPEAVSDPRGFLDVLSAMRHAVADGCAEFRQHAVASGRDRLGNRVVYPPADLIPERLNAIFGCWDSHKEKEPAFAGMVAMTTLMNLHPYQDGNGRVGRMLFNWTFRQGRDKRPYLPIYEISAFSNCGYLIRLRLAQYQANWEPLANFFLTLGRRLHAWR
jgi:hypothetical protein